MILSSFPEQHKHCYNKFTILILCNGDSTMNRRVSILGITFENTTLDRMTETIKQRLNRNEKTFIVTANPEIVMYANQHVEYMNTLKNADYIVPDGIGIIIGSKFLKQPLQERVAGFDLMHNLLHVANEEALRVFLLGAKEDVISKTVHNITKTFPNLHVCGYHHGYFDLHDKSIQTMVKQANPDLIFVALGYPKQEMWINEALPMFEKGVFMGVGGSFDVWAGEVKRAPELWRKLNLEWLYRLIKQPSRWKRMLFLPLFLIKIIKEAKKN